jgi:ketosteroid isomerase-like protein
MLKLDRAGLALAVVLAGSLAACSPEPAKPTVAEEPAKPAVDTAAIATAIKADVAQLVTELNAKDAEKAVSHDAPDYVGMFHGMPNVHGPAEDLALTKLQVSDPNLKIAVSGETVDVAASGDMAVFRATYTATLSDMKTNKPVTETGNWVMGYKAQPDGSWKSNWAVISDTGPAPAPPK